MLNLFRKIAIAEAISYIVLLFVAMPLKYLLQMPSPVRVVGWAHGVLFIAYVVLLALCWIKYRWTFLKTALYFGASLLPFMPFLVEKDLRKRQTLTGHEFR